jgi:alpha-L-arabinofuranosidase
MSEESESERSRSAGHGGHGGRGTGAGWGGGRSGGGGTSGGGLGRGVSRRTVLRGTALGVLGVAALPTTAGAAAATQTSGAAGSTSVAGQAGSITVTVDTTSPGHAVSPDLYGIFFEEINYGGVGGLYPELIRNRAFMDPSDPDTYVDAQDVPRVPGVFGNALQLNGGSPANYVLIPEGIFASLTDFTVAAWVNPAALPNWERVFDFGDGEIVYMFMTASAGGTNNPRFAITVEGNGNEQRLDAPEPLATGEWTHLAVTLAGTTATLYVNGVSVDTNTSMTLNPTSLGPTTQNYIGHSQFPPDPYLDATVDDFQVYDYALTATEIAALLTAPGAGNVLDYHFDEAQGDVAIDSSGNGYNGMIELVDQDWSLVADDGVAATASIDTTTPLNDQLTQSLKLEVSTIAAGQRAGMANIGYFGIPAVPGQTYKVSFFAKATTSVPITVDLESDDGSIVYGSATVRGIGKTWKQHHTTLKVPKSATLSTTARFVISVSDAATVWLQVVSVFPPTYKNRPNGLRPDLVRLLEDLHPRILRFPGGNYVEGDTVATRWDWKTTIGPIWKRPGHDNSAWGYWSDDGLGLLEFLQLTEDLGATPVMAVWAGLTLEGAVIAEADLAPYVQDAVDQIEYAIGPVTSTWGAKRAADGHPAPFSTPYVEIGNEDFLNGGTTSYNDYRYPMFYDAIKAAYPRVKVVATTSVTSRPMDVLDEHFYESASWFESESTMFDSQSRSGPQIFVGEYSATADAGSLPTGLLGNSIGEAAFMTGLERNSDIVRMSSYAPLFANYNHTQWDPDLIGFDQVTSFGSTSYYVQQMFASNVGDFVLPVTASATGLYYSATTGDGKVYLKVVNPSASDVPVTLAFTGSAAKRAHVVMLNNPDPTAGNTLTAPDAVTPARSVIYGTTGSIPFTAPAYSLSVITVG